MNCVWSLLFSWCSQRCRIHLNVCGEYGTPKYSSKNVCSFCCQQGRRVSLINCAISQTWKLVGHRWMSSMMIGSTCESPWAWTHVWLFGLTQVTWGGGEGIQSPCMSSDSESINEITNGERLGQCLVGICSAGWWWCCAGPIEIEGVAWVAFMSGSESVRDIMDSERQGGVWHEPINMGAADCALDPDSVSDIADGDWLAQCCCGWPIEINGAGWECPSRMVHGGRETLLHDGYWRCGIVSDKEPIKWMNDTHQRDLTYSLFGMYVLRCIVG